MKKQLKNRVPALSGMMTLVSALAIMMIGALRAGDDDSKTVTEKKARQETSEASGTVVVPMTFENVDFNRARRYSGIFAPAKCLPGSTSVKAVKCPEPEAKEITVGYIQTVRPRPMAFCAMPRNDTQWKLTVILDQNGNDDLTDDKRYVVPLGKKPVELPLNINGQEITILATASRSLHRDPFKAEVTFTPKGWFKGKIKFNGADVDVYVADMTFDGKIGNGDFLFLDKNGNGTFDPTFAEKYSLGGENVYLLTDRGMTTITASPDGKALVSHPYTGKVGDLLFGNEFGGRHSRNAWLGIGNADLFIDRGMLTVTTSPGGKVLVSEPYSGKICTVRFSVPEAIEASTLSCWVNTYNGLEFKKTGPAKGFGMSMPAIDAHYINADISMGGLSAGFNETRPKIKGQESLTVTLVKPKLRVDASCSSRELSVDFKFIPFYSGLREKGPYDSGPDVKPPLVEVFAPDGKKPLFKIKRKLIESDDGIILELLGARGAYVYRASIPKDVKTGDRLIVRVTYEKTVFGPITGENTVTVK